jgi:hypothetical protein
MVDPGTAAADDALLAAAAAKCGVSLEEYKSLGMHESAIPNSTSTEFDPEGPPSARQLKYINDLGYTGTTPSTRRTMSDLIKTLATAYNDFRAKHNSDKPVTGRQRQALLNKNYPSDEIDDMTKERASEILGAAAEADSATPDQLKLLTKLGKGDDNAHLSKTAASDLIKETIALKNKPTPKQLALIRKLRPGINEDTLAAMDAIQAANFIATVLAAIAASKKSAEKGKRKRKDASDDDDDAPPPSDGRAKGGAYG